MSVSIVHPKQRIKLVGEWSLLVRETLWCSRSLERPSVIQPKIRSRWAVTRRWAAVGTATQDSMPRCAPDRSSCGLLFAPQAVPWRWSTARWIASIKDCRQAGSSSRRSARSCNLHDRMREVIHRGGTFLRRRRLAVITQRWSWPLSGDPSGSSRKCERREGSRHHRASSRSLGSFVAESS